jgi:hypothetical protein
MRWPSVPPKRGDVIAIVLCIAIGIIFVFTITKYSTGFGPEWICTRVGAGDPYCIKRLPTDRTAPSNKDRTQN